MLFQAVRHEFFELEPLVESGMLSHQMDEVYAQFVSHLFHVPSSADEL